MKRERQRETVISQPFTCWFGKQNKINAYSMKEKTVKSQELCLQGAMK